MKKPRGDNQQRILEYIKAQIQERGYPPSVREIGDAVGLKSTSTVHGHLVRLEKKGLLHRDSMKTRAMEITNDPSFARRNTVAVPVVGRVTAGIPILAEENIDEFMYIPEEMIGDGEHFILWVKGESMIRAGIMDGDHVIVHKQSDANNGDIVVAMIDDEATVKRFYREADGLFRLQPENPDMEPIMVDHVAVLGKVVMLYRKY